MEALLIFLGFICFIYFIMIVVYSGITTSFCWIWLVFAAVFGLMAYFCSGQQKNRGGLPRRFPIFVTTSFLLALLIMAALLVPVLRSAGKKPKNGLDYVVVLGAKIYPDRISSVLKSRLDCAYAYYLNNPETIFVLSGGQGPGEPVPEAMMMYNYLYRKGIPAENMLTEFFSKDTAENIQYSALQIAYDKKIHYRSFWPEPMRVGILTSDFHIFRAMELAEHARYVNAEAIPAKSDPLLFPHYCVRECAAILKDHILGNLSSFH